MWGLLSSDKYSKPRLSLYTPQKTNNYRYIDRTIAEMLQAGATDLYIHKYLGPTNQGPSVDATQPQYDSLDPTHIQDLLFMENRDRTYEPDIIRLRGHYNVQNLDFDLSQFGLFLNNDILFITVHYNTMIDLIGRKLIVGDVLELPHLLDYNPLNDKIPTSLRRFYQVTDGNYASEGFSPTCSHICGVSNANHLLTHKSSHRFSLRQSIRITFLEYGMPQKHTQRDTQLHSVIRHTSPSRTFQ